MRHIGGGAYEQVFDDDAPEKADCWVYEDLVYIHKRHVAAVGFDARRDDDDADHLRRDAARLLRPQGPPRGHGRSTTSRRRCASRRSPASAARRSPRPRTTSSALACVGAYNDWMVEEWCGDSGGRLIPLMHRAAVGRRAGRRRGAPQRRPGRARRVLQRDPAPPRAAVDPLGRLGPVLRRLRGDADHGQHAHRVVVADAGDLARRPRRRSPPRSASTTPWRR